MVRWQGAAEGLEGDGWLTDPRWLALAQPGEDFDDSVSRVSKKLGTSSESSVLRELAAAQSRTRAAAITRCRTLGLAPVDGTTNALLGQLMAERPVLELQVKDLRLASRQRGRDARILLGMGGGFGLWLVFMMLVLTRSSAHSEFAAVFLGVCVVMLPLMGAALATRVFVGAPSAVLVVTQRAIRLRGGASFELSLAEVGSTSVRKTFGGFVLSLTTTSHHTVEFESSSDPSSAAATMTRYLASAKVDPTP